VRAFIAIEIPAIIYSEIAKIQGKLQRQCNCHAKWVVPDSIHLTLNFLGEVPPATLKNAQQAMLQAVIEQQPFELTIDKLGAFPSLEYPRIIWIGLNDKLSKLKSLQIKLEQKLLHTGLALEEREFCPHLTLARISNEASYAEKRELSRALSAITITSQKSFSVQTISLIQSRLTPRGTLYNTLFSAELRH